MGDSTVINEVGLNLKELLSTNLEGTLDPDRPEAGQIVLGPPNKAGENHRLSLWLYQITENEFAKNQAMQRGTSEREQKLPPLALDLLYLLTPLTGDEDANQRLLGRAMRVLYDNARIVIPSRDKQSPVAEEISIVLARRTLEELTRIWEALRESYRLSVCYEVHLARIESRRTLRVEPVSERELLEAVPA